MFTNRWRVAITLMGLLFAVALPQAGSAGEYPAAHVASPDQYRVLVDNPEVLVLKMVLQPGESDVMHHHHNETVYFQQGGELTITEAGGATIVADVPDGHVMWHANWSHQVTNSGETEVVAIIVEDKP